MLTLETIGRGIHRSGWPYATASLKRYSDSSASIVLDDYVERTFLFRDYRRLRLAHTSPWIGICHHPADVPEWYDRRGWQSINRNPKWVASLPFLRLVVTLGEHLTRWVADTWEKPCITLRHPTAVPRLRWSPERFEQNSEKQLIQIGSWLRNTQAIYQVRVPNGIHKTRIIQSSKWIGAAHKRCQVAFGHRPDVGEVTEIATVGSGAYDVLLSRNIVFVELIAAVANNTIVECIARNTPIVVNRLPGPEYYLGKEYPLFYENLDEVGKLLSIERICAAHQYLRRLDKSWITGAAFARALANACREAAPELWQ